MHHGGIIAYKGYDTMDKYKKRPFCNIGSWYSYFSNP